MKLTPYFSVKLLTLLVLTAPTTRLGLSPALAAPTTGPSANTPATPLPGKLLIIGGNIGSSAKLIFSTLANNSPDNSTIGIIPAAAGEPGVSSASAIKAIAENAPGRKVIDIPITTNSSPNDPVFAEMIRSCGALYFTGGQQDRIVALFNPDNKPTALYKAVEEVLAKGGIVSGSSAGAAMMSDTMINGGTSESALSTAPDTEQAKSSRGRLPLMNGMGFFKYGIVDQHFLQRGRAGRLLVALEETNHPYGFGISEGRAILVDRTTHTMTAVGPDALFLIDRTKSDQSRSNIRVSLLSTGDILDFKSSPQFITSATKSAITSPAATPTTLPANPKPWDTLIFRDALHYLATTQSKSPLVLSTNSFTVKLIPDADTRFFQNPERPAEITVLSLRMDVYPTPASR